MGSKGDWGRMKPAVDALEAVGVRADVRVMSAHRTPERHAEYVRRAEQEGIQVFICGAGLAAHLPGVVASKTILPVIGVPLSAKLNGTDALYSMVQMPKPIPVATVGIDNSFNAGMLAVQMLALVDADLSRRLGTWRENMRNDFIADNGGGVEL